MSNLKIRPISTGRFLEAEKSNFTYGMDQGLKIESAVLMYLVEGGSTKILVDTGGSDTEWAGRYHHPLERTPDEEPVKALEKVGVAPSDIDVIVNTHLHWDHCFNNHLFPRAKILVQAEEMRYAILPLRCQALFYESQLIGMTPPWLRTLDRMEAVEGEKEIEEGIRLIPLPGHTLGFQGVLVELESGPCLIAGDNCPLFENWEGKDGSGHIPPGIHADLRACYDSFNRMDSLTDRILPGHDLKVLDREIYE